MLSLTAVRKSEQPHEPVMSSSCSNLPTDSVDPDPRRPPSGVHLVPVPPSPRLPSVLLDESDPQASRPLRVTDPSHAVTQPAPRVEVVYLPADVLDLVPRFLANRCADVGTLHDAIARRDLELVRAIGHKMIGSGGGYGFEVLAGLGYALEHAARHENVHDIAELTLELEAYLARVRVLPTPE